MKEAQQRTTSHDFGAGEELDISGYRVWQENAENAACLAAGLEPLLIIAASVQDESTALSIESAHCKQHLATITNIHDPAKGAKDLKREKS